MFALITFIVYAAKIQPDLKDRSKLLGPAVTKSPALGAAFGVFIVGFVFTIATQVLGGSAARNNEQEARLAAQHNSGAQPAVMYQPQQAGGPQSVPAGGQPYPQQQQQGQPGQQPMMYYAPQQPGQPSTMYQPQGPAAGQPGMPVYYMPQQPMAGQAGQPGQQPVMYYMQAPPGGAPPMYGQPGQPQMVYYAQPEGAPPAYAPTQ